MPKNDFRKNREERRPEPEPESDNFVTQEVVTVVDVFHPVEPSPAPQPEPALQKSSTLVNFYSQIDKAYLHPLSILIEVGIAYSKTAAINDAFAHYVKNIKPEAVTQERPEQVNRQGRQRRRIPNMRVNDQYDQLSTQIAKEYDMAIHDLVAKHPEKSKREHFNSIVYEYLKTHEQVLKSHDISILSLPQH